MKLLYFLPAVLASALLCPQAHAGPDEEAAAALSLAASLHAATPANAGGAKGPVTQKLCYCSSPADCICTPGKCECGICAAADPDGTSLLIVSRTACEPCRRLEAELRAKGAGVPCSLYVDSPDAETKYGATAFPTVILLRNGSVVATWVGFGTVEQLSQWRKDALSPRAAAFAPTDYAPPAYRPTYAPPMRYAAPMFRGGCPTCGH